ncbi:MAG: DUF350 domain-containing protein [Spirochaetes bacterium]|nr:DUF350 domain-containing protein [Spirochaetota bacterium]
MTTQFDVFFYGLIYVIVSLVFGTLTIFLFIKVFNALTRDIDDMTEMKNNNIAVALINSAIIFSVALFISESIAAAMEAFKNNIFNYIGPTTMMFKIKIYIVMFIHFALSIIISFSLLWLSMKFFTFLTTTLDEFAEIKKNNQAVAIFLSAFIISIALILKPGVGKLLKGIIPLPEVQNSPRTELHINHSKSIESANNMVNISKSQRLTIIMGV